MTKITDLAKKWSEDPEFKREYDRLGPVYEIVSALIEARHNAGLTQEELAIRMGTTQSAIARLENAHRLPSVEFATRYASAVGRRLAIQLLPRDDTGATRLAS